MSPNSMESILKDANVQEMMAAEEFERLKSNLRSTWMAGDYEVFAHFMRKDAKRFFDRLGVAPGMRLLDVGCGSGQLALIAARAGAEVVGCDIATNWLERGRRQAEAEKLNAVFREGDAEALPFADAHFDVVVSLIGAMFAPRPERVAAELIRVCHPGGKIAMANWTPTGFVGLMFKTIARYIAPSGMPSPVLWGEEAVVRERLAAGVASLQCSLRTYHFEYPFPPSAVVDFFRTNYGPTVRAFAALDAEGQRALHNELTLLWSVHNQAMDQTTKVDAEYLEIVAIRK